jgi:CRP-like cAMP-binding protein
MNTDEKRRFLERIDIFAKCSKRDLKSLARSCDEMEFSAGDVICRQGEKGAAMYIVAEGAAEVFEERDAEEIHLARIDEGDVVGELSVIDGEVRTATVRATEPSRCLVLTSWDLRGAIRSRPEIALDILFMVVRRYRALASRLAE